jgi:hypothetical protein
MHVSYFEKMHYHRESMPKEIPFRQEENRTFPSERFNPQLVRNQELFAEYQTATAQLLDRIRSLGIEPQLVLAFGSLTRQDKKIRMQPDSDILDSDADFLCIVKSTALRPNIQSLNLRTKGESSLRRQIDGEKAAPFSEHIPYFQVEFFTIKKMVMVLTEVVHIIREYQYVGKDADELAEEHRWIWGKFA